MKRSIVLAAVLLAACGIDAGTVTSRSYEDPYVEYIWLCSAYDSRGACTFGMDYPSHVPECWRIHFAAGDDENSACVGRSTWDSYQVGDHFDINAVEVAS